MLTIDEICAIILSRYDPDDVVELLDLTTEDLVSAFEERIEEKYEKLNEEFQDD